MDREPGTGNGEPGLDGCSLPAVSVPGSLFPVPAIVAQVAATAATSATMAVVPIPTWTFDSPSPRSTSSDARAMCSASRPRASTHTNPPRRSSVTTRGVTVRRAGDRSARESATVRQAGLQRQTNIVRCYRDRDVGAGVPARRARPYPNRRRLDVDRIIERPATPLVAVRQDLRLQAQLGQRRDAA